MAYLGPASQTASNAVAALLERIAVRLSVAQSVEQKRRAKSYAVRGWAAVYAVARTCGTLDSVLRDQLPVSAEYVTALLLGAGRHDLKPDQIPTKVAFVSRVMANQASLGSPKKAIERCLGEWAHDSASDEFDEWLIKHAGDLAGVLIAPRD